MGFDNRIFNVNGEEFETLEKAIELAFILNSSNTKAASWHFLKDKGLVLSWHKESNGNSFPVALDAKKSAAIAWEWLKSDEAKAMKCEGWDADQDHDGSNGDGWRVYVEDWGHVGSSHYAICAIRPVYVWFGK